ncbi:MAG TPA: 2-C-methyl-D-erythritol 4-phosphate cytidylyltransferase [Candidatus Saccharimonadales bacterium]|nr:2-C-methyl-D-erythritol 4-phosphate cytidylyltransferase [Candidatus Saccharimonadales bacterium]
MSEPVDGSPGSGTEPAAAAITARSADVIVVAAGVSSRMGGIDKVLAPLGGRPLLAVTLDALAAAHAVGSIVVVTAADRRAEIVGASWLPADVIEVVTGGARRQDSVRAGFDALERLVPDPDGGRVVLVHDGARPLVSTQLVTDVAVAAARHGAAIPVVPIVETVKRLAGGLVEGTLDRSALGAAQTPQGMRREVLRAALASAAAVDDTPWTDEAALLEACRIPVHVVDGDPSNLKVTVPADLARAARLLDDAAVTERRTGIGQDRHPFGPGSPLRLGGIELAGAPRLFGHSDGDVALHAVADALLGAAGLGDLGRLFPAGPSTPAGIESGALLATVVARLAEAGWRPAGLDVTIIGARPRLGDRLDDMATAIAGLLSVGRPAVNVKASTGNLEGSDGAGRSISALAVATIVAVR